MLILLSPTKNMNVQGTNLFTHSEKPLFHKHALKINRSLEELTPEKLRNITKVSSALLESTQKKILDFECVGTNQTLFAYSGTVFKELEAQSLPREALDHGMKHLRILSAMYGILRPNDLISPYRLEMKTALSVGDSKNLYEFWKPFVNQYLQDEAKKREAITPIINLASQEYSKVIDRKNYPGDIITISFKDQSKDKLRTIGMYSKMARGRIVREILERKIHTPQLIKEIRVDNYAFSSSHSNEKEWVFIR